MREFDQAFLSQEAKDVGVVLDSLKLQQFATYLKELKAWNRRVNLTSLQNDLDILVKHFIDSLLPLRFIPFHSSLLDIGSGAGFPGIPLKIAEPSLSVTLLDSKRKKVFFQRHIIRMLDLRGIEAIHGRAEELKGKENFSPFDVVISRALYSFEGLQQVSKGCLKKGGTLIVLKTPHGVREEEKGVREGFRLKGYMDCTLPLKKGKRRIVLLEKR